MPRLLPSLAVLGAVTPVVLVLPVATPPAASAHPVRPTVAHVALGTLPAPAGSPVGPALRRRAFGLAQTATGRFSTVGVTWRQDPRVGPVLAQVRWRAASGWSSWHDLGGDSADAPDAAAAGSRDGTAPLWVGSAHGVQVRLTTAGGVQPADPRVELVDPASSSADGQAGAAPRDTAFASEAQPAVLTRADWGADESIRRRDPSYAPSVKVGFVHHTDTATDYTPAETAALIRGIYAYHVLGHGWDDIGYNFLVDRFGRVWEGRYGGITRPVIGAHTEGFNIGSFGTALLGTFSTTPPPAAMLTGLEQLLAWRLGIAYRDPLAGGTLLSGGGSSTRWPKGTLHTFADISGHRDAGWTTCPGDVAYLDLAAVRAAVAGDLGTGFVDPSVSPAAVDLSSATPFAVRAGTLRSPQWTLTITDAAGLVVRTLSGEGAVSATWDRTTTLGLPVRPGEYALRLTGRSADGDTAVPWLQTVQVRPPHLPKSWWLTPDGFSVR